MTNKLKNFTQGCALALAASTGMATAGAMDRSGQSIDILFESGNRAELSFGYADPNVTGLAGGVVAITDMAPGYALPSFGVKFSLSDKLSAALIYDRPFGATVAYAPTSPYGPVTANVYSNALTALLRYDISDRILVFGGASVQSLSANVALPGYTLEVSPKIGVGYVVGAAYQIPDIALRVALTYRSEIATTNDILEGGALAGTMPITTPQSVNLEFQTGVNPKTLVFGSIRWANWSAFDISPPSFPANPLVSYDNDVITYSLGVGRKLTDTLSAAVTVGYERSTSVGGTTILAPTDGNISLGVGLTYDTGNGKITGGVKYIWLGDTIDQYGSVWEGNTAIAAGISYSFEF